MLIHSIRREHFDLLIDSLLWRCSRARWMAVSICLQLYWSARTCLPHMRCTLYSIYDGAARQTLESLVKLFKKRWKYSEFYHMQERHFMQGRKHLQYDETFASTRGQFEGMHRIWLAVPQVSTHQIKLLAAAIAVSYTQVQNTDERTFVFELEPHNSG